MKTKISEKGEGLVEYAFILVLVAIIVIFFLTTLDNLIRDQLLSAGIGNPNEELLSDAPLQSGTGISHPSVLPVHLVQPENLATEIRFGKCLDIAVSPSMAIKVGTVYEQPEFITITRDSNETFSICNQARGVDVYVYIAYVEVPQ